MSKKLFWPIFILFFAIFAGILVWSGTGAVLRPIFLFLFLLVCPGLAFTRLMHIGDMLTEFILAITISLAISILLAELMVFTHLWSPPVGFTVLIVISLIGAALQYITSAQRITSMDK